jgi:hypothetical protein
MTIVEYIGFVSIASLPHHVKPYNVSLIFAYLHLHHADVYFLDSSYRESHKSWFKVLGMLMWPRRRMMASAYI